MKLMQSTIKFDTFHVVSLALAAYIQHKCVH